MRRKRWFLLAYSVVLATSHAWRVANPRSFPAADKTVVHAGVNIAYYDSAPGSTKPVVLLIHGSPGSSEVVRGLAGLVPQSYRVIAPDLPGFGASEHRLADYSFRAHAQYLLRLLDRLNIARVHAVGFSMGGGVVLSLADIAPNRVCSIEMISALGVQEEELSGSYSVNHALHGLMLAALWTLRELTPHFGLLDRAAVNVEFARNFFDSDQRPLRQTLASYLGPMLIIHGLHDRNVPPAAATEHHRLVPQSRLVMLNTNHFMIFRRPQLVAEPLNQFLGGLTNSCEP